MGKSDYLAAGSQLAINGDTSMLVGEKNAVTGDCSGVVGQENVAAGACSFAEGKNTTAKGNYSHAAGENTVATQSDQFVVGRNNNPKSQTLFEVGGGGTSSARTNSFEVYPSGYVSFDDGETKYKFTKYNGKLGYYDIDGYFHRLFEPVYLTQSVTLSTSGDVTMTFTNAAILSTSLVDVYTPEYSIAPKNVVVASGGGSCTVTFGKVSSAQTISVQLEVKNP